MRRTHFLLAIAVVGLSAGLLLPRLKKVPTTVSPTPTTPFTVTGTSSGSLTMQATPSRGAFIKSGDELDVVYEVTAPVRSGEQRLPVDFALVLDRSGSMTGDPLMKAKAAAIALVDRLTEADRMSFVHFGSEARLGAPLTTMDAAGKAQLRHVISLVYADGGTNISGALETARASLRSSWMREGAMRRIVLLSDGQANEGLTGPSLTELATRISQDGLRVSALGLGYEFDERAMLSLADAGRGQYRYIRTSDEVVTAFSQELSQAASTAASGLTLVLQPMEGVTIREVVGYQSTVDGGRTQVALSDLASGERRRVVVRVHSTAAATGTKQLVSARLTYNDVHGGKPGHNEAIVTAEATEDSSRVASSLNRDTFRQSVRARWGGSMLDVFNSYNGGDDDGAQQLLESRLQTLGAEAGGAGDAALIDSMREEATKFKTEMKNAPSRTANGRYVSKSLMQFAVDNAR